MRLWRTHSCVPCSHSCEHVFSPCHKTRSHECERGTLECVRHIGGQTEGTEGTEGIEGIEAK
jgi:hypothetical protein